jgi:hypothetical protein
MTNSFWRLPLIFASILAVNPAANTHQQIQAPVERSGFLRLTSYDSLQAFLQSLDGNGRVRIEKIATTRQGRAVSCCFVSSSARFGIDSTKLRVMLFAQQHGDEPSGKEALTMLLGKLASHALDAVLDHIDLLVIPQMNPDGAELRQRRTSDSLDLNRNHLILTSPEPRGLHELFATWWPQVTMDIHEYGPFSKSWSDSGFIKRADVQLGMLTNLNSSEVLHAEQRSKIFPFVEATMKKSGYAFSEYVVGSPGDFLRYSTTEPNDGRQGFGILSTLSFIQEGRGGEKLEDHLERRVRSQLASIEALLSYCGEHGSELCGLVNRERVRLSNAGEKKVVLCMDHFLGGGAVQIPVRLVPSGRDTVWQIRPLHGDVKPIVTRTLPAAYIVPRELESIIKLFDRHHVQYETVPAERRVEASVYLIDSVQADTLEDEWHPKPFLRTENRTILLRPGDVVARLNQVHSSFLGVLLEPESMWGLVKYRGFEFLLRGKEYPVLRIP